MTPRDYAGVFAKIKDNKRTIILFLAIFAVGIFFRSYHFHDWLDFESDQARDLSITEKVVNEGGAWPLLGPDMSHSQDGGERFHIGPVYYYFQIISGHLFGVRPETAAYPDLFFSILSIPLFYLFLKRYFEKNLSLALTGIYTVSFYIIQYSRFAYNTNPIPFFVILFLLSLSEFLSKREKVSWIWTILAGVALGVGIQLHVTLLLIFPTVALFVFLYILKNSRRIAGKLGVILLIALALNLGQMAHEIRGNFANSKVFFHSVSQPDPKSTNSLPLKLAMEADCQFQANFHMLSSLGDKVSCDYSLISFINPNISLYSLNGIGDYYTCAINFLGTTGIYTRHFFLLLEVIFSFFGYGFLVYYFRKETGEKKQFLGLIILYCLVSFFVIMPVIDDAPLRYFLLSFFVPYIFLGFLANLIVKKIRFGVLLVSLIILFLVVANFSSLTAVSHDLAAGKRSGSLVCGPDAIVLGEIEPMASFIAQESDSQNEAYILHTSRYTFYNPIKYLAQKNNVILNFAEGKDINNIPSGKPVFYFLEGLFAEPRFPICGHKVESYKRFANVTIYKLQN